MREHQEEVVKAIRELAKEVDLLGNAVQTAAETLATAVRSAAETIAERDSGS